MVWAQARFERRLVMSIGQKKAAIGKSRRHMLEAIGILFAGSPQFFNLVILCRPKVVNEGCRPKLNLIL
jgi:hypothetical protein